MKPELFQLTFSLLSNSDIKPVFFIASESEVFLAWGQSSENENAPRCCSRYFNASSHSDLLWSQFSSQNNFTPEHFVFLDHNGGIQTNTPNWYESKLFEPRPVIDHPENEIEDFENWKLYCHEIEKAILRGELKKVVPARTKTLTFSTKLKLNQKATFFQKLIDSLPPNAHLFAYRESTDLFMGASPELLFKIENNEITVPAIAGTRPNYASQEMSQKMTNELISSPKERQEHQYVVDYIENTLSSLGLHPTFSKTPEVLTLKTLQHLQTLIKAPLKDHNVSALTVLEQLHPTPATAGIPKQKALELINRYENFSRGLYASPLGYILPNGNARFVVCLRSLLLKDQSAHLFAGAGFINTSNYESEWLETSQKMQTMGQLFGKNSA